jgi:hypothetical protein
MGKAQLSREKTRGGKWVNPILRFRLNPVRSLHWSATQVETTTDPFSSESGCEVSEVEENLSRKINIATTKSSVPVVQSVYP